jgi:LPXTG-motif cell wall-anchored protein
MVVAGTLLPANALSTDQSEAEGRVLSGGGVVNLNDIVSLNPAYSANPSAPDASDNPLSASVLNALDIDLGGGVQLFGPNGVIGVGALGQHAHTSADGTAFASSGAVQSDGSIAAGAPGDTGDAFVDVTNLLDNAGLGGATDGLISQLRVELGAITATATQTPGASATGDYQIAGGKLIVKSPVLSTLSSSVNSATGGLSDDVNALAGPTGALGSALGGVTDDVIGPLEDALGDIPLVGGLVNVDNVGLAAGLTVDLQAAVNSALTAPLVSTDGATLIDLSTGTITIDLAELHGSTDHTLNDLAPNTELLDGPVIQAALDDSINSALNQLPALLVTTINNAINNATLTLHLTADAGVTVPIIGTHLDLASIDAVITGTVGGFLGASGSTPPVVDASGTTALGAIPVGDLLDPIVNALTNSLLPAVVTPLQNALTGIGVGDGVFQPLVATATTALQPLFGVINDVVSITANVQETPGTFTTAGADSADSFTERALQISLLPVLGTPLAEVNLASATVRASVVAVAITSPDPGTSFDVPTADDTTSVPVTGTGQPGADISVTLSSGGPAQTTTVDGDGNWTVTFPSVPVGSYTATAEQTIGDSTTNDSTTFTVVVSATTTSTTDSTTDSTSTTTSTTPGDTTTDSTATSTTPGDTTSTSTTDSTSTSTTDSTTDSTATSTTPGDTTSTSTTDSTSTSTTPGDTTTDSTSTSTTPGDTTSTSTTDSTSTSTTPGDTTSTSTTDSTSTSTTPGDTTSTSTTDSTSATTTDSTSATTSTSTTPGASTSASTSTTDPGSTSASTSTSTTPSASTTTSTSTTTGAGKGGLASTGSNTDWALPVLVLLFLAGGGALLIARRKRVSER